MPLCTVHTAYMIMIDKASPPPPLQSGAWAGVTIWIWRLLFCWAFALDVEGRWYRHWQRAREGTFLFWVQVDIGGQWAGWAEMTASRSGRQQSLQIIFTGAVVMVLVAATAPFSQRNAQFCQGPIIKPVLELCTTKMRIIESNWTLYLSNSIFSSSESE